MTVSLNIELSLELGSSFIVKAAVQQNSIVVLYKN